jgi:hypothetical protein
LIGFDDMSPDMNSLTLNATNLAEAEGSDGELRRHDGSASAPGGIYLWDSTAGSWRQMNGQETIQPSTD